MCTRVLYMWFSLVALTWRPRATPKVTIVWKFDNKILRWLRCNWDRQNTLWSYLLSIGFWRCARYLNKCGLRYNNGDICTFVFSSNTKEGVFLWSVGTNTGQSSGLPKKYLLYLYIRVSTSYERLCNVHVYKLSMYLALFVRISSDLLTFHLMYSYTLVISYWRINARVSTFTEHFVQLNRIKSLVHRRHDRVISHLRHLEFEKNFSCSRPACNSQKFFSFSVILISS